MPSLERSTDRHQARRPTFADDAVAQLLAVVVDVIHMEARSDAQALGAREVIAANEGAVFEAPTVI